jgi:hypothetical protein
MIIYDAIGQELRSQPYQSQFDMRAYSNGLYFLKVIDQEGKSMMVKVVKE